MSLPLNQIVQGNCLEVLKGFPDESIDCVMTSPPYWGLRVYGEETEIEWPDGWRGQLGLEPHPNLYIEHLVLIFREVRRVLKRTGSLYVVLGDTFAGSHCARGDVTLFMNEKRQKVAECLFGKPSPQGGRFTESWIRPKQQLNIPFHVAYALQCDGWLQRDRAIWHKNNAMPGSQKDRLTCSYEFIFRFVKNDKTILWRNMETGEWRDSRPVQMYVKYVGNIRISTTERPLVLKKRFQECSDLEVEERRKWRRLWMGFDYYYELDAIREPHTTSSIKRAGITGVVPFNLRVRDVKSGKGGVSAQGRVMDACASEREVDVYSGKFAKDPEAVNSPRARQARFGYDADEHYYHALGKNPGDVYTQDGRNVGTNVGEKGRLVDRAVQWRPQTRLLRLDGKNPGDVIRDKTANEEFKGPLTSRQAPEPCEPQAFHPLGKNPGDVLKFKGDESQPAGRLAKSREEYRALGLPEGHPLGKNPGDIFQAKKEPYIGNNPHRMRLDKNSFLALNPERPSDLSHPLGKNPGDVVGYNSKYFLEHGQTIQGFIRSQSQFKERVKSRELAKQLFPNDPEQQQAFINYVHDHYGDPKGPNPRDVVMKIGSHHGSSLSGEGRATHYAGHLIESHPLGANPSDFWSINTKPYKGAHFAVYPVAICVKPILSSCPRNGVVLDPMAGSGSTCVAAKQLGRKWIGIEVNSDYVKLARERLEKTAAPLDAYLPG